MPNIQVQNLSEVVSAMNRIRGGYNERDVAKVMLEEGGKPLRDELRDAAPKGTTGNLRRAIQARIAKAKELAPAVYVSVSRRIAPHLHLVTGGTKPHIIRPKSALGDLRIPGGHPVKLIHHPGAKPNDYFAQTWNASAGSLGDRIAIALGKLLDRATR